jgi:integrase
LPDTPFERLETSLDRQEETTIVNEVVNLLVADTPSLDSLGRDELRTVAKAFVFDSLKEDLKRRVELGKIDYAAKRSLFLARYAKRSKKTEAIYRTALDLLDTWAGRAGVNVLDMKASHADAFIDSLEGSSSTVRLRVSGVSSFFTFLERETDGRVRNPFRGTKARPIKRTKAPEVPSIEELGTIMENLSPPIQAAVVAMMEHGFRVGALRSLTIRAGRYTGESKGKDISGPISPKVLEAIKAAELDTRKPWADLAEEAVRNAFKYVTAKLYNAGKIKAQYSVHDIRHYFAIREYLKNKDIYRLKTLLGHASIQVTENYLRGIEAYWKI